MSTDTQTASLKRVVLATGNAGKVAEMQKTLEQFGLSVLPQKDFDIVDAIEDGLSFVENAIIKARHACALTGLPAIADDSGLEVDALNGAPGIYSARYADGQGDHSNNQKLLEEYSPRPGRAPCCGSRFRVFSCRHNAVKAPMLHHWSQKASRHRLEPIFAPPCDVTFAPTVSTTRECSLRVDALGRCVMGTIGVA